jgi:hypothetical protein
MNKKLIRLTESELNRLITESVNRLLMEYETDIDDDNYFGGGLPDNQEEDIPENDSISDTQISQLDNIAGIIADIANNTNDDTELLFQAASLIDKFTARYRH